MAPKSGRREATPVQLDRRRLIKTAGAAAAAGILSPGRVWGLNPRSAGANDRVRLGLLGCGVRGAGLVGNLPEGCELVAAIDPIRRKAFDVATNYGGSVTVGDDYRSLFDRDDVDAAMVCSTDHHHAHATILACQAGMDVYVEKPLTASFHEGRAMVDAARRYDRVVQVGTQQRSMEMNQFACELVRDGGIGDVKVVEFVNYPSAAPHPVASSGSTNAPDGINWDAWIGPAPMRPYDRDLVAHWSDSRASWWGVWRDYTVGQIGGMGAHGFDMVQYALGTDDTGPVELWPMGIDEVGVPRVDFRYANGVEVRLRFLDQRPFRGPRLGAVFTGTKCKIEINRNKYRTNPRDFVEGPDPEVAKKWEGPGWIARGHIAEWIDAIKARRRPNTDIEIGHRVSTISHLVDITRAVNRRLRWDPVREEFPDDAEANALLSMPRRDGWALPG